MPIQALFFAILIGILFSSACQKYDEGPLISLSSPHKRMCGQYHILAYTVNGVDSLSQFKDSIGTTFTFYETEKDNGPTILRIHRNDPHREMDCSWGIEDKTILHIHPFFYNLHGIGPFTPWVYTRWKILQLSNKEAKFRTYHNDKEYVVELEKIDP